MALSDQFGPTDPRAGPSATTGGCMPYMSMPHTYLPAGKDPGRQRGGPGVEIRVGVRNVARELVFESDQAGTEVRDAVTEGLAATNGIISLRDDHGRMILVPAEALGYVEVGSGEKGKVGFGSA
ncbi:MAG: DUF3107 domain-containing protein [Ornithinimicrobium sp.]